MKVSRARAVRVGAALTLASLVSLPLAACGSSPGPGVAATSDGFVVTESDLDDIARDFSSVQGAQVPSRTEMVSLLVARPFVLDSLSGSGQVLSEEGVRQLVQKQVSGVSDATVQYLQVTTLQQQLDPQKIATITQAMSKANITVDPRYGTYEPGKGLVATPENWIVPQSAPASPADPGAPDPGAPEPGTAPTR